MARSKGSVVSNLIDIDLQAYEPVEEREDAETEVTRTKVAGTKDSGTELLEVRPTGLAGTRRGSLRKPPHPPGPVGLDQDLPRTRLWIKRPPGPAGL
jgi:hypothetical protein